MTTYHQMGHNSMSLLREPQLSSFGGAILSPVNLSVEQVRRVIKDRPRSNFEFILDPQLYFPKTERGELKHWSHFPSDVESADLGDPTWMAQRVQAVASLATDLGVEAVCSPAFVEKAYPDAYYERSRRVADELEAIASDNGVGVLQTVIVDIPSLAQEGRAERIASIVSAAKTDRVFLVLLGDMEPRKEYRDPEDLKRIMRLIAMLAGAELKVLVGFSSSDAILWVTAGATGVATGKFFNLRRFTTSRFDEPKDSGGSQLPYWAEEALLANLRESDLIRVRSAIDLSSSSLRNPYATEIIERLDAGTGDAWIGLGWRQYLWWFADVEARLRSGETDTRTLLREADRAWGKLDEDDVLMEERHNDGAWVRQWRRAVSEYGGSG